MKTIREGHPCWHVADSDRVTDRAYLEINPQCPANIAGVIMKAYSMGYIELGVNFTERELALLALSQNRSATN